MAVAGDVHRADSMVRTQRDQTQGAVIAEEGMNRGQVPFANARTGPVP